MEKEKFSRTSIKKSLVAENEVSVAFDTENVSKELWF